MPETFLVTGHSEWRIGEDSKSRFNAERVQGEVHYYFDLPHVFASIWYYLLSSAGRVHGQRFFQALFHDCWPETFLVTAHSEEWMGENSKLRFKAERVQGEVYYYFDFALVLASFEMIFFPQDGCMATASWKASFTIADLVHSSSLVIPKGEWERTRNHV